MTLFTHRVENDFVYSQDGVVLVREYKRFRVT